MLEMILKLYYMAMTLDVRSPVPHLVGPPGCGKSTVVAQAAELIGVNLHILNVSRMSPLEIEGVQMPETVDEELLLRLLHSTIWTQIKHGDIVLFDEFLRGFPEVYNALLDIFTSRTVAGLVLPKFFIIAASNSVTTYDKALEDRLLHLPVPDPRKSDKEGRATKKLMSKLVVDQLGLLPEMATAVEMEQMLAAEVLPMYSMLDSFAAKSSAPTQVVGRSIRNLIGQAQLRQVQSSSLAELVKMNNIKAMQQGKVQFVVLIDGKDAIQWPKFESQAQDVLKAGGDKLTDLQRTNLTANLQLIEMESIRNAKKETTDDDASSDDDIFNV
jgi:hypothetical protein